jgi:hypothetical protein
VVGLVRVFLFHDPYGLYNVPCFETLQLPVQRGNIEQLKNFPNLPVLRTAG